MTRPVGVQYLGQVSQHLGCPSLLNAAWEEVGGVAVGQTRAWGGAWWLEEQYLWGWFTLWSTWDGVLFSLSITSKMPPKKSHCSDGIENTNMLKHCPCGFSHTWSNQNCSLGLHQQPPSGQSAQRLLLRDTQLHVDFPSQSPNTSEFPQSISCSFCLCPFTFLLLTGLFSLLSLVSGWSCLALWFSSDLSATASCVCSSTILLSTQDFCLSAGHWHVLMTVPEVAQGKTELISFLTRLSTSLFTWTAVALATRVKKSHLSQVDPLSPLKNLDFFFFSVIYAYIVSRHKVF